jgi:hypothetical protein
VRDPHVVLELGHILFAGRFLGKRPGQHEFGLEYCFRALHDAVEGCRHPGNGRVPHAALNVSNASAGVALIPGTVELLGRSPKLYDQVAGQVLRFRLSPLLAPELD